MSPRRTRVGIIGAGRWGRNLIRAFGASPRCDLRAICDVDPARLEALGHAASITAEHASVLLREPELDAVAIATPAAGHAELALRALHAGKHVFVEKPMALTLADALRMRQAAHDTGRCLMVGHILRYHPALLELRRLVDAGQLGAIRHLIAHRVGPRSGPAEEGPWWALGPHDVSVARFLLEADVSSVSATERSAPDGCSEITARLRIASALATIVVGNARPEKTRRLVVEGTEATAVLDDAGPTLCLLPGALSLGGDLANLPPRDFLNTLADRPRRRCALPGTEPLANEVEHFLAALLDGAPIATDPEEGCRVVAALEAGSTSIARNGAWVSVAAVPSGVAA